MIKVEMLATQPARFGKWLHSSVNLEPVFGQIKLSPGDAVFLLSENLRLRTTSSEYIGTPPNIISFAGTYGTANAQRLIMYFEEYYMPNGAPCAIWCIVILEDRAKVDYVDLT